MTLLRCPRPRQIGVALALAFSLAASAANAQTAPGSIAPTEDQQKEAKTHFQRAVQLYSEADYRAALVEFKRAYEIAPHVQVLYNIGQAYYQLQSYAEALNTFERFLSEGGTAHRSDVEQAVEVLKTRVGKIDVTTASPGWDIAIDDEPQGKTPLPKPIAVSVGRRKVTAAKQGETTMTKMIEVAAGDTKPLAFDAPTSKPAVVATTTTTTTEPPNEAAKKKSPLYTVGWVATGVLAAGAIVTGIVAASEASKLSDARDQFPGNKDDIHSKSSTTTAFSVTCDILWPAAIIVGGITLYFTLTRPKTTTATSAPPPPSSGLKLGGGPGKFILGGTF